MCVLRNLLAWMCIINVSKGQEVNDPLNNLLNGYEYYPPAGSVDNDYDFIIVGSGSSGSVIANRLSEISNWKILLLEAGEQPTVLSDVPVLGSMFQFTDYNWGYLTEKQENFGLGLIDQRMHWPRGKVVGGTSTINFMIYTRGNRHDYDRWAALGNPGWSYKDVLPYFLKSEDATIQIQDPEYHNSGGYLSVEDVPYRTPLARVFINATQEVGYNYVDYNGENQLGVSYFQATTRHGMRCSVEKAFLRPAMSRPNLTILTKSRVTKVLIDPKTRTAYGVKYIRNKRHKVVKASKEVILSAGVFNSPQLLMLSGVGPKDHLRELGLPVLQNLPVGQKLYDHMAFLGLVLTTNQSLVLQQRTLEDPSNLIQLLVRGEGPLTLLGSAEAVAFLKTNVSNYPENYPDVELIFSAGGLQTDKGQIYRKAVRVSDEVYNRVWKPIEDSFGWSVIPVLLQPKSCGHMKLKSKNPFQWPKLYGNYFTDPEQQDVKTMIAAIREIQRIVAAPIFQKYGIQQINTPLPGCEKHPWDSDGYWECALRHITVTGYHQTTTCKMGPFNDPEAVVDSRLRVYGINHLRVADTSIIPISLSGHTNAPAYMVGEKAADIIKEDWNIRVYI